MRKLNTSDVFAFARIVKASGMREELKKILKDVAASEEKDLEDVGMDTILAILEALSEKQSEAAIYNDFHDRKDLNPNVCAVFTEPDCQDGGRSREDGAAGTGRKTAHAFGRK